MAPLFGMACILSGLWFLFGMPVIAAMLLWDYRRTRKLSAGLLVTLVMVAVFYICAVMLWRLMTPDSSFGT